MRRLFGIMALNLAAVAYGAAPPSSTEAAPDPSQPAADAPQPADPAAPVSANSACPPPPTEPIRRRPGQSEPTRLQPAECDPTRLPTPEAAEVPQPQGAKPVDRWRIIDSLGLPNNLTNPYATNNPLKGDRPVRGNDDFLVLTATSNSLVEERHVPVTAAPDAAHLAGRQQLFINETASIDAVLYKGDTVFRPPDYQFRFTPIFNYIDTRANGQDVITTTVGAQALFFEKHLRDVSENYDFDSVRAGIQAVTSDFRGFVLADQPVGVRFFGTRDNDFYQYNIGWFRTLPKNAARQNQLSGPFPTNDIVLANLYVQDLWKQGLTSEFVFIYNRSRVPGTQIVAPTTLTGTPAKFVPGARHDFDVGYLGYSADGHVGKLNLTLSLYAVLGREAESEFGVGNAMVEAGFAAFELSRDFDWIRVRASGLYSTGDSSPLGKDSHGFDGISQAALFAGADSTFFIHQRLALVLNQVDLKQRDSLFPDLRSTASTGTSNYENPGLRLVGLGGDFDLMPALRISFDANHLWFDQMATLETLLGRAGLARDIGTDVSVDGIYRPFDSQNVILRLSASKLFAAPTARVFVGGAAPFSTFFNLIVTY